MKIVATLIAAAMALSMVPAASASDNLFEKNYDWLMMISNGEYEDAVPLAQLAASKGVDLQADLVAGNTEAIPGSHVGELWHQCVSVTIGTPNNNCDLTVDVDLINLSPPCGYSIPAHWALFVWLPCEQGWSLPAGIYLAWTEQHAGLGPLVVSHGAEHATGNGVSFEFAYCYIDFWTGQLICVSVSIAYFNGISNV